MPVGKSTANIPPCRYDYQSTADYAKAMENFYAQPSYSNNGVLRKASVSGMDHNTVSNRITAQKPRPHQHQKQAAQFLPHTLLQRLHRVLQARQVPHPRTKPHLHINHRHIHHHPALQAKQAYLLIRLPPLSLTIIRKQRIMQKRQKIIINRQGIVLRTR